ncbi:MAG: hypothetical protein EBV94_06785 [Actinobacteria bacterium]|nr:hypothetical protein [Actinomycetota bacterium]
MGDIPYAQHGSEPVASWRFGIYGGNGDGIMPNFGMGSGNMVSAPVAGGREFDGTNWYGTDNSAVYRQLYERDLTRAVANENAPYEALISSGTFTHGHLGPECLRNLLPLLANNGWLVVGVNNEHFEGKGFAGELDALVSQGAIGQPEILRIDVYEPGSVHYGDQARVIVTRAIN